MSEHIDMAQGLQSIPAKASHILHNAKEVVQNASSTLMEKFQNYKGNVLEVAVYAGIGFVIGFLFKKYLKYLMIIILFIVALIVFDQFDLVHTNINWQKIQELFDIQSTGQSFNAQAFGSYVQWAKANVVIVLSASVGFLLGLKLG